MKILCVIDSLNSGGAQRQIINIAIGLKEKGHEVSLLVYHDYSFYKTLLDERNIYVHHVIEPNYFKRLIKMRSYIRKGKNDVVLSFLEAPSFICEIATLPTKKWKLIVGERNANPKILTSFKLRMYRWFHFFADCIVANSNENINLVRKANPFISSRKFRVIFNGLDTNLWTPLAEYIPSVKDVIKIVVASRHSSQKNLDGLIEAVNLLGPADKRRLKIDWHGGVRSNNCLSDGLKKIESYGLTSVFTFHPDTLDIKNVMQKADVVGLFSLYEGFPNCVCEGMAVGKPIISTAVSDVPYFVSEENGFLCEPTPDSIAASLKQLLNTDEHKLLELGRQSRRKATELFNINALIENYNQLLKELVKN